MNNTELNLAIFNGVIYTILGMQTYTNGMFILCSISLLIAFIFAVVSVILDK